MTNFVKVTRKCELRDYVTFTGHFTQNETFEQYKKRFGKTVLIIPRSRTEKHGDLVAFNDHIELSKQCEIVNMELGAFWSTKYNCGYHVLITAKLHDDIKQFEDLRFEEQIL